MLKKHSRLSRELFLATFKRSRRLSGVGFQLLYSPSPSLRVGAVISKKIAPHAVTRNYIRRRVYGFFRAESAQRALVGTYVVLLTAESKKHTIDTLLLSLTEVLARVDTPARR